MEKSYSSVVALIHPSMLWGPILKLYFAVSISNRGFVRSDQLRREVLVQEIQVLIVYGRVLGRDYHLLSRHEGVDLLLFHLLANLLLLETFFQIHLRRHPCEIGFAIVGWL